MKRRVAFIILIATVALILPFLASFLQPDEFSSQQPLTLRRPEFISTAHAYEARDSAIGDKLDREAGIAAYYKTPGAINLDYVRGAFRTIEDETADYIIGSVAYPDHPEKFDVHAYVHEDGWILAYYLKADPASKIADVKGNTVDSTKLQLTISTLAGLAGQPFSGVTYYDFRFPNATHMMLIAEDWENGRDFTIQLPSEFGYFERSWLVYDPTSGGITFAVDGVDQGEAAVNAGDNMYYGILNAAQLSPGVMHEITIDDYFYGEPYAVLTLIYSQP